MAHIFLQCKLQGKLLITCDPSLSWLKESFFSCVTQCAILTCDQYGTILLISNYYFFLFSKSINYISIPPV